MPTAKPTPCAQRKLPGAKSSKLRKPLAAGKTLLGWTTPKPQNASAHKQASGSVAQPSWMANNQAHSICIAPTGGGKGRSSLIPQLLNWRGSAVVVDPKGEAAMVTGRYRAETL